MYLKFRMSGSKNMLIAEEVAAGVEIYMNFAAAYLT